MENGGRLPSVTKKIDDLSGALKFQFMFYCDYCGAKYRIVPIPFSVPDAPERVEDFTEAQKLIWESEHEDAYERANREALVTFRKCTVCGKTVCEDCAPENKQPVCPACRG
ncbi:MAG TPA: hypothetical protein DEB31_04415 [Clostridiales bacterium]|nr:hypothetical protein [Clostridiales bacterium]HCC34338.1 hypothetical protein [Oscillospiraceae bacterium]